MKHRGIALALGCLLLAGLFGGCARTTGETASVQAITMVAEIGGLGTINRYGGMVVAQKELEVQKDVNRTVSEVKVTVGQEVKVGDVLFTYDIEEIQIALEKLQLEKEQIENNIVNTNDQISELEQERANAASGDKLAYSVQIQELEISLTEAKYNLSSKEKEIERTQNTLDNAEVKSTINGVVKSIAGTSEMADSEAAFITITETGEYKVKGSISELNMGGLGEGVPVIIRSRIDENQIWSGTVEKIDWGSQESNSNDSYYGYGDDSMSMDSTYPFYVVLDSADGLILGQHVYIEPDYGQSQSREGIWLSSAFLCDVDGNPYVWAADSRDRLEKRSVALGEYDAETDLYQIVSGLEITDYIAFPAENLTEGMATEKYDESVFGGDAESWPEDGGTEYFPEEDGGTEYFPEEDGGMEEFPEEDGAADGMEEPVVYAREVG